MNFCDQVLFVRWPKVCFLGAGVGAVSSAWCSKCLDKTKQQRGPLQLSWVPKIQDQVTDRTSLSTASDARTLKRAYYAPSALVGGGTWSVIIRLDVF